MGKIIAQFKALPPLQRYILLLAIPIVVIVYLWFMFISPTNDEISKLKMDIQKEKTEIENLKNTLKPAVLENLRNQEKKLMQDYQLKQAELVSLVGEIPTERDMALVVKNIGSIARKSNLTIMRIQVSNPQKTTFALYTEGEKKIVKEYQQQQQTSDQQKKDQQKRADKQQQATEQKTVSFLKSKVELELLGTYPSLKSFLDNLQQRGIISYPESLSISPEGQKIRAKLEINTLIKEGGQP